ncbi:unnamed protein product [Camellia sinensis]
MPRGRDWTSDGHNGDAVEQGVGEVADLWVAPGPEVTVTFGPIVAGAGLAEDEVVGSKDLAVGTGADAVHGARFEIHEDVNKFKMSVMKENFK